MQYTSDKSEKEKEAILEKILKDYLSLGFEHPKPANLAQVEKAGESEGTHPVDEAAEIAPVDLGFEIEKVYSKQRLLEDLTIDGLRKIDPMKLENLDIFMEYLKKGGEEIISCPQEPLMKRLKNELGRLEEYMEKNNMKLDSEIPKLAVRFSLEQLDHLIAAEPKVLEDYDFFSAYTKKKLYKEILLWKNEDLAIKKNALRDMYQHACKIANKHPGLKSYLGIEMLELGIKLDEYNEELLIHYLAVPARHHFFNEMDAVKDSINWHGLLPDVIKERSEDEDRKIIEKYLFHLFINGAHMNKFEDYLDEAYLKNLVDEMMVLTGQKIDTKRLDTDQIEFLSKETRILFCEHNKERFSLSEEPSLFVELKNVPTLIMKIYEINAQNYYKKNLREFRSDINLDGLIPTSEKIFEYKHPNYLVFREIFKFPELSGKKGIYIVDLHGNGKHSRAIIRLGSLSFMSSPTIAGQECFILGK